MPSLRSGRYSPGLQRFKSRTRLLKYNQSALTNTYEQIRKKIIMLASLPSCDHSKTALTCNHLSIIISLYSTEMKNGYQWRKGKTAFCTDELLITVTNNRDFNNIK